jgi:hypothetical protein
MAAKREMFCDRDGVHKVTVDVTVHKQGDTGYLWVTDENGKPFGIPLYPEALERLRNLLK